MWKKRTFSMYKLNIGKFIICNIQINLDFQTTRHKVKNITKNNINQIKY